MFKMGLKVAIVILGFTLAVTASAQTKGTDHTLVADDAAWCWFSDPRAVSYQGVHEKIYYGYINSKGDVVISTKDLGTGKIENFVLHAALQIDDHNVPSILFLPDGRLLVFYTEHNGRFFIRKSVNPEDITDWEPERIIPFKGTRITYSHPVMLEAEKNRIYVFWRGSDWSPTFSYSDDLGETWSPEKILIDSKDTRNRPYIKVVSDGISRIDIAFTDGHPGVEPTNSLYHMYYERGVFFQTNGDHIASVEQLPILRTDVRKVYDATASQVRSWIQDIALDKDNRPVLVYARYPEATDHRYHYAYWNNGKWSDEELCRAGGWMPIVKTGEKIREPHYSGGISLDHDDPSHVYLSREIGQIFEIEHWCKTENSWQVNKLTERSDLSNVRPYVVGRDSGKNTVVLWMSGVYNHYTKFKTGLRMARVRYN